MRFISMVGSKEHPVPKKKEIILKKNVKKEPKKPIITGIDGEFIDEQVHLKAIGENIEDKNLEWKITFDGETITPSSVGPILILNETNTNKYIEAEETEITITIDNYVSPAFV